ncbi:MAG: chemotaxis response regulator protein-glutamate methylesterase [Candidatus Cloacimonadota bacterium]|nr:MAG: chemotaxis response regulator protein-glutamate methylesterase [Candidatus Cloacimonadota bacterium]
MVVDDTIIYRKILKDVIESLENAETVASASNGKLALRKIETHKPELILLDVEMPEMDGLEALKVIKQKFPEIGVIMVSGINERQAAITMEALQRGAIDFVPKPIGRNMHENIKFLTDSLKPIVNLFLTRHAASGARDKIESDIAEKKTVISSSFNSKPKKPIPQKTPLPKRFDVMVIGVSTGGPNALAGFIPELPADLGVPILLVQHMPPMFTKSLANHLNAKSAIEVTEAINNQILEKNKVYVAPGGKHMVISEKHGQTVIEIIDSPPVNSCKPSVDVLFDSVAKIYKNNVLSVIMTGMGADGMSGVEKLKQTGCYSITQSEKSCVVYGMPRAVAEAGFSDESVDLDKMSARVTSLIKKR